MPDALKPVILWILCEHGEAKAHDVRVRAFQRETNGTPCPGGRPATVADLKSACRALDWLVIEKVDGEWPEWVTNAMLSAFMQVAASGAHIHPSDALDALAEAQK